MAKTNTQRASSIMKKTRQKMQLSDPKNCDTGKMKPMTKDQKDYKKNLPIYN